MKYNSLEEVKNLRIKLCNNIEDELLNEWTIEFNQPFTIYVTEDNTYDDSQVKVPYLIRTLINGKFLSGRTHYGDEFDDFSIYDLDDIVEVAYILDTIGDKQYKILEDDTK
jgi:hypothetical protein